MGAESEEPEKSGCRGYALAVSAAWLHAVQPCIGACGHRGLTRGHTSTSHLALFLGLQMFSAADSRKMTHFLTVLSLLPLN